MRAAVRGKQVVLVVLVAELVTALEVQVLLGKVTTVPAGLVIKQVAAAARALWGNEAMGPPEERAVSVDNGLTEIITLVAGVAE